MWILLGVLLFLVCLVTAVLLLPVYVTIRSDEEDSFYFRYKFLGKTYGENPDPNNPIVKTLKSASGITRLEKDAIKNNIQKNDVLTTLRDDFSLVVGLLKELFQLLKRCRADVFRLEIVCADGDAADAAIQYGRCWMAAGPVLGYLHTILRIKPAGERINIRWSTEEKSSFAFETVLMVRVHQVIAALWRVVMAEAKRMAQEQVNSDKNQGPSA